MIPIDRAKSLPQINLGDYWVDGGEALGECVLDHVLFKVVQRTVSSCHFRCWLQPYHHQVFPEWTPQLLLQEVWVENDCLAPLIAWHSTGSTLPGPVHPCAQTKDRCRAITEIPIITSTTAQAWPYIHRRNFNPGLFLHVQKGATWNSPSAPKGTQTVKW